MWKLQNPLISTRSPSLKASESESKNSLMTSAASDFVKLARSFSAEINSSLFIQPLSLFRVNSYFYFVVSIENWIKSQGVMSVVQGVFQFYLLRSQFLHTGPEDLF